MKDEYLGTIKGDDLCDYPQYRLSGKVFTRKIPACRHLTEKGFTIPEGLLYLKMLEEEASPKEISHYLVRVVVTHVVTHDVCVNRESKEEEAVKHALELIRRKEGDDAELHVDSVVTVYTDSSRHT